MWRRRKRKRKGPGRWNLPELTTDQILRWADAHHGRLGQWPQCNGGPITDTLDETWRRVDRALRKGLRGLPGGSSLTQLLAEYRGVRNQAGLPPMSEPEILTWADAFHQRHGSWPHHWSGPIPEAPGETWARVDKALLDGLRGLPGGSSLPRFLAAHRGHRNSHGLPPFSIEQILRWADLHHERTGHWPHATTGAVVDAPGESWKAVEMALMLGRRGLPGGSSLARLFEEHRGVVNRLNQPRLSRKRILAWMDAHYQRTGQWPTRQSGPIAEAPGESWSVVDSALQRGCRGLRGGSSLIRLLHAERGVRNDHDLPPLTEEQIIRWAKGYYRRHGEWPSQGSGRIPGSGGESWATVNSALKRGTRGLPAGSSIARLLAAHGLKRNPMNLPRLTEEKILRWADRCRVETGRWPTKRSGPVLHKRGENWGAVDAALYHGSRGLPGGSSLVQLLAARRGVRNRADLPHFSVEEILAWADAHFRRTGHWPLSLSGAIPEATGETWTIVDKALRQGLRGLPGGSSLPRLLLEHRGAGTRKLPGRPQSTK